ncbi:hypothetical protein [Burkholderia pseudomallei]|uniref:hypothetical protein n=1 Tax=Burkholderia pseudomallei TaxID=28450 RepID=UPI0011C22AD2|nr:hypothetical protein [Burkholderia pseudomallei]
MARVIIPNKFQRNPQFVGFRSPTNSNTHPLGVLEFVGVLKTMTLPLFHESHSQGIYAAAPCRAANQFFSNIMGLT